MEVLPVVASWALSFACRSGLAGSWLGSGICPPAYDVDVLLGRLSETAQIHLPGSDAFAQATTRWTSMSPPTANLVVVPGVEEDVAGTVKYANEQGLPFLVVSSGHGPTTKLGRMKSGIVIWMKQLSGVEIAEDGKTARIGGGTLVKTVMDSLWAAGKQTVTGACECPGVVGPGLGGGHGILQGRYGLIADQFVSLNVVLADGTLRAIDGETDPDLWWAMRGAGHNFGIVTSARLKIYDVKHRDWAFAKFVFSGDHVEALFEGINEHFAAEDGMPPVDIVNLAVLANDPEADPDRPVMTFLIFQEGSTTVDSAYTASFHKLGPLAAHAGSGTYLDIPAWTDFTMDSPPCQKTGNVNQLFPIDVDRYNVTAQRRVYDLFAAAMRETPAFRGSFVMFEGYSLHGVRAVPGESTAFPFRGDNLLLAPVVSYAPGGPELDRLAVELGERFRAILHEGSGRSEMHTYVNYGYGSESLQNVYGFEAWRLEKLRRLKKKYDPAGRFSFYAPIE